MPPPRFTCLQGRDHTLFALVPGTVKFRYDRQKKRRYVSVEAPVAAAAAAAPPVHIATAAQQQAAAA